MKQWALLLVFAAIGYGLVFYLWPSSKKDDDLGKPPPPPRPRRTDPEARWFEVLGVDEDAPVEEITRAYRSLMAQYHPDRVAQMGPEIRAVAEEKSKQLNKAYEFGLAARRFGA